MILKPKKEKIIFTLKFIFYFNVYSNLLFILAAFIVLFNVLLMRVEVGFYLQLFIHSLSAGLSFYLLFKAVLISSTYKPKWKFYSVTKKKIERHGFNHNYFETAMYEPCMRIITWDILRQYKKTDEYRKIKDSYCKLDFNLKIEKDKLIKELNNLGAESIEFN